MIYEGSLCTRINVLCQWRTLTLCIWREAHTPRSRSRFNSVSVLFWSLWQLRQGYTLDRGRTKNEMTMIDGNQLLCMTGRALHIDGISWRQCWRAFTACMLRQADGQASASFFPDMSGTNSRGQRAERFGCSGWWSLSTIGYHDSVFLTLKSLP